MITDKGKDIISKYLLGYTSSYASHIAVGCGEKPLSELDDILDNVSEYRAKEDLSFEMFRVPISSRGIVNENNTDYVVFTAELPSTEYYGMTEVGVYSAGSNPEAGTAGSKILYTFSNLENWEYHTQTSSSFISSSLESSIDFANNNIFAETEVYCFDISANSPIFLYSDRKERQEVPRFLNSSILVRGDRATINIDDDDNLIPDDTISEHLHLTGASLSLDQNAPTDELRLAFSIINVEGLEQTEDPNPLLNPDEIRIVLEFASGEGASVQKSAMEIQLINDPLNGIDFSTNRYFVVSKRLEELRNSIGFSWDSVTIVKAYASVLVNDEFGIPQQSDKFYVAFDGLRVENKTDVHPLYALTGFTVVKNTDGTPVIKTINSTSFIEFRFAISLDI